MGPFDPSFGNMALLDEKTALCYLGLTVEFGRDFLIAKSGMSFLDATIMLCALCYNVNKESYLTDRNFEISLKIGLTDVSKKCAPGEDTGAAFEKRLLEIFPKMTALLILNHALRKFSEDLRLGKKLSMEELEAHLAYQKAISQDRSPALAEKRALSPGTFTQLKPCPKCGLAKRVDANTKNFHCKPPQGCGFNQPYTFDKQASKGGGK